jgi:hypothetical protein
MLHLQGNFLDNIHDSARFRPFMKQIRSIATVLLRTGISLAAAMVTLLLVQEMVAPVSAANRIDSSDGLIDAQITRSYGTIHSRPAMNPTTPPAPPALSVAPTYPSYGGHAESGGIDR